MRSRLTNVGVFAVAFSIGMFGTAFIKCPPAQSSDWASWTQAVGAIVAIGGAYIIGERQSRAALAAVEKAHRIERTSRHAALYAVVKAAHNRVKTIEKTLQGGSRADMMNVYHHSILDSLLDALNKLPVHELASEGAIDAFIIFSGQLAFLRGALDKYVAGPYGDAEFNSEIQKLRKDGDEAQIATTIDSKNNVLITNAQTYIRQLDIEFSRMTAGMRESDAAA